MPVLWVFRSTETGKGTSVEKATIIGVDLAKNVFQVHGAAADGTLLFRKKLTRLQFHRFMADQPACVVAMEACGGAHYWAREMRQLGHDVRLIAPRYVKPFIKRQKNDTADAEAIVEAALRPTMRFVEPKTEEQRASTNTPAMRGSRAAPTARSAPPRVMPGERPRPSGSPFSESGQRLMYPPER